MAKSARDIQVGWKVVKTIDGRYYSCFVGNVSKLAVKEYSDSRWTRRGHEHGPLAAFRLKEDAQRFLRSNRREANLEKWMICGCIFLPETPERSLGMLWFRKRAPTRDLPAGTILAKAVRLTDEGSLD